MRKTPGLDYMRPDWVLDVSNPDRPQPVVALGVDGVGDMLALRGESAVEFLEGDLAEALYDSRPLGPGDWRHLSHLDPDNPRPLQRGERVEKLSGPRRGERGELLTKIGDHTQVVRVTDLEPGPTEDAEWSEWSEWIEHEPPTGVDDRPVPPRVRVIVDRADGYTDDGLAEQFYWSHMNCVSDIKKYSYHLGDYARETGQRDGESEDTREEVLDMLKKVAPVPGDIMEPRHFLVKGLMAMMKREDRDETDDAIGAAVRYLARTGCE